MVFSSLASQTGINKDDCCRLIGIATDGASVNIASGGLKGLVEKQVPWAYWMWCMAHRLELAIKDALKGISFDLVDEMLLCLYYIYDKSPKKCRELEGIVSDLRDCFQFDDEHSSKIWSTYSSILQKLSKDGEEPVYQCQSLKGFSQTKLHYENNYSSYCSKVNACIKARMQWSDLQTIRDVIFVLGTQGWQKLLDKDQDVSVLSTEPSSSSAIIDVDLRNGLELEAIDRLVERFEFPLQSAGTDTDLLKPEFESLLFYAGHFIQLSTVDYQSVWWCIFHSPNCNEWTNLLIFIQLLFALPTSNGKIERVFSQLNIIKTEKRTALSNDTMDDLLVIRTSKSTLNDFSPESSIRLLWEAKTRRPNQRKRRQYAARKKSTISTSTASSSSVVSLLDSETESTTSSDEELKEEDDTILLDDWD